MWWLQLMVFRVPDAISRLIEPMGREQLSVCSLAQKVGQPGKTTRLQNRVFGERIKQYSYNLHQFVPLNTRPYLVGFQTLCINGRGETSNRLWQARITRLAAKVHSETFLLQPHHLIRLWMLPKVRVSLCSHALRVTPACVTTEFKVFTSSLFTEKGNECRGGENAEFNLCLRAGVEGKGAVKRPVSAHLFPW